VIDDLSTGVKSNQNSGANYIVNDIYNYCESEEELKNLIVDNNIKIVFHLAGLSNVREGIENPIPTFQVNFLSSIAISDICSKNGVEKFIFVSTSAVYGDPHYFPVDESHKTFPKSPYGLSKLISENYFKYLSKICEMDIVVFRLPNVYGPRQRPDLEGGVVGIFYDLMKNSKEVTFFGDGYQTRDWVHVYDIVDSFVKILKIDDLNYEIISLGSEKKHTLIDLFKYLSEHLKYNLKPNVEIERVGDIKYMIMSGRKAKKLLDWEPKIQLNDGVKIMD
jgi:UDP-glucose 4-epimerase